ncbi:alpha/beta hydrolase [Nitrosomonas communis]|uniref:Serine aminopeptidase, S33 n=1 Tax=Nitrosomonas communis TaxID=44574 RepID=A0A1I4WNU7_9PROT|nr:alpha/beta fold hydrolase [Nitrosomonas communis]SFN14679.1 Serine aminopeptidase, S33 [Nitrosomonas communis]
MSLIIALTLLFSLILLAWSAAPALVRRGFHAPRRLEQSSPAELGLAYREIRIPTVRGKQLFGWLIPASLSGPQPIVAVLHGWGGNAEDMLPFASLLHRAGLGVLLVNARNHGRSDADTFSSMPRFAEDLQHALDWLVQQPEADPARLAILGHSVGAAACLLVASQRRGLAAVISIAAFVHPAEIMRQVIAAHHIPYWPIGRWVIDYVERTIGHRLDDIAPLYTLQAIHCPVLLVHGDQDRTVPVTAAETLYAHRPSDTVQLWVIPGVAHDSVEAIQAHGDRLLQFLNMAMGGDK